MYYVPTYLTDVKREVDGWPANLSREHKDWLIGFVSGELSLMGPQTLSDLYQAMMYRDDRPRLGVFVDYYLACLDRACREVATQVWTLRK